MVVDWEGGHRSSYSKEWLKSASERRRAGPVPRLWGAELASELPRHEWEAVSATADARRAWLRDVATFGFALLHGVPCEDQAVERVASLFGSVRVTNYGRVFDVRVAVGAANLADTALPLSAHTDNPYREPTPTLQLLHCLATEVDGGETMLVDGFAAVERLRTSSPEQLAALAREPIRFAYRDETAELEAEFPVVSLDADARPRAVHLNNRSKGVPHGSPDAVAEWYGAYLALLGLLESPQLQIVFRLEPGDVVVFDNLRVLHGRTGFRSTGTRLLQGCYADRDGLLSTLAVLER